jgi:4-amino-4-deoxy-L-arabinose transferase-like glycosyltransferase
MSTKPSRMKPSRKTAAAEMDSKLPGVLKKRLVVVLSVVVFAGIPFALGKYFELKYPDPFDSGSYVYSAQHVLLGARIGYEEKPSAQAGTLLVNMLGVELTGFNETGSKLLQGLFQAAALTLMFFTIRRLYGTLAAIISVSVASIYLSAPVIAKYGNVKEQFMIALMIAGICCFVWYRLTGRWWWALLTGALLIGGPLFKQTGVSAIAAVGLFVLAGPILYHYAWKTVGKDILLLVAGAMVTLTPICAWYASMGTPLYYWPYSFALGPVFKLAGAKLEYVADTGQVQTPTPKAQTQEVKKQDDSFILRLLPGYVSDSWRMLGPAERRQALVRVLRYYRVLILPIVLALAAVGARAIVVLRGRRAKSKTPSERDPGVFVLLFGVWWFLDMAFAWISPHSYEQYYLPLNASGAMLGGYFIGLYGAKLHADRDKTRWTILGLLGVVAMTAMSWHIFFGITRSPHSGAIYGRNPRTQQLIRTRGYLQKWQEVRSKAQYPPELVAKYIPQYHPRFRLDEYPWRLTAEYIREHSKPDDMIYVWGWVPGIYVQAQRMSPTPKAFEGTMHTLPPAQLADRVQEILTAFERHPPKFIVDSRKEHFPWGWPPFELWPIATFGGGKNVAFLPTNEAVVKNYDSMWASFLRKQFGPEEAQRYEVLAPLRQYVMKNYQVAELRGYGRTETRLGLPTLAHELFDVNVVFVRK